MSKFDNLGQYQWTKAFLGTAYSYYPVTSVDSKNNIYIAAAAGPGELDCDPGLGAEILDLDSTALIWIKLDADGLFKWAKAFESISGDLTRASTYFTHDDSPFLVGLFYGTVSLNPLDKSEVVTGYDHAYTGFISRFDSEGNLLWTQSGFFGGSMTEGSFGEVIYFSPEGRLYAAGALGTGSYYGGGDVTSNAVDFDPGAGVDELEADGVTDIFITQVNFDVTCMAPEILSPADQNRTTDRRPHITGNAEAGSTVSIYRDGVLLAQVTADSSGRWQYEAGNDWAYGTYVLTAQARDASGNVSPASVMHTITIYNLLTTDDDLDGLSYETEMALGTSPSKSDTDGDGVKDGEEVQNGTNPLDPGSFKLLRDTRLCVEWNGYLGMQNVLEHVNTGDKKLLISSDLYDLFGKHKGRMDFRLKSGYQYDLLVGDLTGYEENRYGLVCSTATDGRPGELDGRMVFYKPSQKGGYSFAFALPLDNGLSREQFLSYNTYQPSLEPTESQNLVANWIQLTNLTSTRQSGELIFFDRKGNEVARQDVLLGGSGRFDYSAHDLAGRNQVGLVKWVPSSEDARFQLRNVRYYYRADGEIAPLGDDFDSAFQVEGALGSGQLLTTPLVSDGGSVVLEISNTLNRDISVEVAIYPASGDEPIHTQTYKLGAYATFHLITDSILKGANGTAVLKGSEAGSVLAVAMHYGRSSNLGIKTVYGLQARETLGDVMRGSYNTYLGQDCRLLMVNSSQEETIATISMKRYDGSDVELGRQLLIPPRGLKDYNLCSQDKDDVYGVVTVQPSLPDTIYATVLRIGEGEQYRFPTPVRE